MPVNRLRLNSLISLLVTFMVVLSLGLALWIFTLQLRANVEQAQQSRVVDLAQVIASKGAVRNALQQRRLTPGDTPSAISRTSALQRQIEDLRRKLGVDFIVVMDTQALRLTHPEPERIGRHFIGGDEGPALAGNTYASRSQGSLGVSIRGFSPVRGGNDEVIGAVSVGVTLATLASILADNRHWVVLGVVALMIIGALGAGGLARYIKRVLLGLEPYQITRLVEERQAMLASVHEGIVAVDRQARITLINPAARQLLARAGLGGPPLGETLRDYLPQLELSDMLHGADPVLDQEIILHGQALLANRMPIYHHGEVIGALASFRDKTEVHVLAEALTGVRRYAEALRASTHEFKNQLHVILGLVQREDLTSLRGYLRELADHQLASSAALVEGVREPVLAGFLVGKASEARERGIQLNIEVEAGLPVADDPTLVHTLVTIIGNLLENAFEAVEAGNTRQVTLTLSYDEAVLMIVIQDTGPGIPEGLQAQIFTRGMSTKGQQRGLGMALVQEQLEVRGGDLSLYSEPGRGTMIEVFLPYRAAADVAPFSDDEG
ncbi:DcuS/MalK family sensor histidine kinase [Halomonas sp. WWR20]